MSSGALALAAAGFRHGLSRSSTEGILSKLLSCARPGALGVGADSDEAPSTSPRCAALTLPNYRYSSSLAAAPRENLLMRYLPSRLRPYAELMRLDKPVGTWLLLLPCTWSIGLAAAPGHLPDLYMLSLFSMGAVLLRGAGCTINDLWDRELDKRVERTRSRPLASGALQPRDALALLALQLSLGLIILLQLNDYSKVLGAASLLLVGTYPLMKRVTFWPQAFLGLTFNWGALLGYAAVAGSCNWQVVLPLYLSGVCWTLVYDTIYAHQDRKDDEVVGIKSTARLFGERSKSYFAGFAAAQAALLCAAGAGAGCGPVYYTGVAAAAAHLAWQISSVDLDNGRDCMDKFVSNKWTGGVLFGAIVLDRLMASGAGGMV